MVVASVAVRVIVAMAKVRVVVAEAVMEKMGTENDGRIKKEEVTELRRRNKEHQQFLAEKYTEQVNAERYFTHEAIESGGVCGQMADSIQQVVKELGEMRVRLGGWGHRIF